jgi:AraC-like DNA-binding protein
MKQTYMNYESYLYTIDEIYMLLILNRINVNSSVEEMTEYMKVILNYFRFIFKKFLGVTNSTDNVPYCSYGFITLLESFNFM